jgi:DNA processing protein
LWVRGAWPWAQTPAEGPRGLNATSRTIAVVGARAASSGGRDLARALASALAGAGHRVVSGGAVGIDAAVHGAVLGGGGLTAAVLAPGLDAPYPARHAGLFERIVASGGTLVSAVPPGAPLMKWQFPARNRLMVALCDAVVIVECRVASGTMTTARAAAELARPLFVVPGSPGTDALLARGARAVAGPESLVAALSAGRALGDAAWPAPSPGPAPDTHVARVLAALLAEIPRSAETVAEATGLDAVTTERALTELELEGLALRAPGGRYFRAAGRGAAA